MKSEGAMVEKVLEDAGIAVNKNTCPGDKSALRPSGLRLGTPALTSRGLVACHMETVADFIHRGTCSVPTPPPGNSGTWRVLENHFGHGKSWCEQRLIN